MMDGVVLHWDNIIIHYAYVKTYAVDVNTSRTPEEGAHSPNGQTAYKLLLLLIIMLLPVN
jgi:hypothetical protein